MKMSDLAYQCLLNESKRHPVGWKQLSEEEKQTLRTTPHSIQVAARLYGVSTKTAWKYRTKGAA